MRLTHRKPTAADRLSAFACPIGLHEYCNRLAHPIPEQRKALSTSPDRPCSHPLWSACGCS